MSIGIYKITNMINGHSYIGKSIHIEERWRSHKQEAKNPKHPQYNYTIHKAFRKYGIDNFSFEIVEECEKDFLNEKEIYWINFFDTYYNGYNETLGGDGGPSMPGEANPNATLTENDVYIIRNAALQCLPQKDFFENSELKNKISYRQFCRIWRGEGWEHILPEAIAFVKTDEYLHNIRKNARDKANTQAQLDAWKDIERRKLLGESHNSVYNLYKNQYSIGGFDSIWYKIRENTKPLRKVVIKLDKNTLEELEIYESAAEAGRQNNCDSSSIIKVCKGIKNSCGGYKWKYGEGNLG